MKRRDALGRVAAYASGTLMSWGAGKAASQEPVAALLQAGGCVLMLRHAKTVSGIGDPPGFSLDSCSGQRNLSDEGREQARRIGQWFKQSQLQPHAVLSSAWCRCRDTATLAFGAAQVQVLPALNSTFNTYGAANQQAAQTKALRTRLAALPAGQFEVWVTHQVNMTDLCQAYPGLGEGFVVSARGALLARYVFA